MAVLLATFNIDHLYKPASFAITAMTNKVKPTRINLGVAVQHPTTSCHMRCQGV
jgi:hypothetical protein